MRKIYVFVTFTRNKAYNTPFDDFCNDYWIPVVKFTNKNYSDRIKIFLTYPVSTNLDGLDVADIMDNIIITDIEDTTIPGISLRCVNLFERLVPIMQESDLILKTNPSSFWVIEKLLEEIEKLPTTNVYKGLLTFNTFVSGAGIIMSRDIASYLAKNTKHQGYDDVEFSQLVKAKGTPFINATRYDLNHNLSQAENLNNILKGDFYHVRVKNGVDPAEDIAFFKLLTAHFGYDAK